MKKMSQEDIDAIVSSYIEETKAIPIKILGKPEPYARARFARRGKFVQCYNPKEKEMKETRKLALTQLSEEDTAYLKLLMASSEDYTISLDAVFYMPIPKADSKLTHALKANNIIKPHTRTGDIDNYVKFILDSMHEVFYTDDKCVTDIRACKQYSDEPRSELVFTVHRFIKK